MPRAIKSDDPSMYAIDTQQPNALVNDVLDGGQGLPEAAVASSIRRAADLIKTSDYVVAMTGAGMSVESGIPPFRGTDGLWTRYGAPQMDGYQQFKADPEGYWNRQINYQIDDHILELRSALQNAQPHAGHFALAQLVSHGVIKSIVTQNIDGLDIKAGAGDVLIEIHGNRSRLRCINCQSIRDLNDFVPLFKPKPCEKCGGAVKFDAVMFGEPIPQEVMKRAQREFNRADCVLAIGTSATIRPASGLLWIAKHRTKGSRNNPDPQLSDARLIEINPNETKLSVICDVVIRAAAGSALPRLLEAIQ